jgi:predicted Zn-dependent protease with MMP-like domain
MNDIEFENIVEKAVQLLPNEFKEKLINVSIVIQDFPSTVQLNKAERGKLLLGLYEGIPQTRRGNYGIGGVLPDKITIFKIPLLQISRNYLDLEQNVRNTVIHEIGHHFGLSEDDLSNTKVRSK